ncbi:hypothetical protein F4780DRAFT_738908 [Xylariomycetidae sp. FL0641]|nr:hypothetical protein F4780DRAFT_738908 [Xylariomycetidae sp. FL0641]
MLTCRPASRLRSLPSRAVASRASLSATRHYQQTRTFFRFGIWSSYIDPEVRSELRRRYRARHRYPGILNHELPWEQQPATTSGPQSSSHRAATSPGPPPNAKRGARRGPEKNGTTSSPDLWDSFDSWRSQVDQIVHLWSKEFAPGSGRTKTDCDRQVWRSHGGINHDLHPRASTLESSPETDYVIDPITNRRISKKDYESRGSGLETPVDASKSYSPHIAGFEPPATEEERQPVHSDGGPPPAELRKYAEIPLDDPLPTEPPTPPLDVKDTSSQSVKYRDEYALNHLPPEDPPEQYDDLHRYKFSASAGPTEESVGDSAGAGQTYDDLDQYRPTKYDDIFPDLPGGRREAKEIHGGQEQQINAPWYDASMANHQKSYQVDPPSRYHALQANGPFIYKETIENVEGQKKYEYELKQYRNLKLDDIKDSSEPSTTYNDLQRYESPTFNDPVSSNQPGEDYGDLNRYRPTQFDNFNSTPSLEQDIVAKCLKEFDEKESRPDSSDSIDPYYWGIQGKLPKMALPDGHVFAGKATETAVPQRVSLSENYEAQDSLDERMDSHNRQSDAVDNRVRDHLQQTRPKANDEGSRSATKSFTGHYIRDFPEDFSGPSCTMNSPSEDFDAKYAQQVGAEVQASEKGYADPLTMAANSSRLESTLDRLQARSRLEPALDRCNGRNAIASEGEATDDYSKKPQGLEISYAEECGEPTAPVYMKSYGGEPGQVKRRPGEPETGRQSSEVVYDEDSCYHRDPEIDGLPTKCSPESTSESARSDEPTIYKILAYDPTMQTINVAETTSVKPDQASALSPTEVLLRLSNPAKFFPHFAPLQAEGFEIVSGSGDILVFRKVRSAKPTRNINGIPVNPIDMMGMPTVLPAGAFASPTGFINYDIPRVEEEAPATAFRSNINVRREEPVFSGPKSSASQEGPRRKKSVVRRVLLGGVWVAGISYALGVVGEYFVTGGMDGKGPTGF